VILDLTISRSRRSLSFLELPFIDYIEIVTDPKLFTLAPVEYAGCAFLSTAYLLS